MRWALRTGRVWFAIGATVGATYLASRDNRTGWTVLVGFATGILACATIWLAYVAAHPDREEQQVARQRAEVDRILWRYERDAAARQRARDAESGSEDSA